jgi:hypothetical protein
MDGLTFKFDILYIDCPEARKGFNMNNPEQAAGAARGIVASLLNYVVVQLIMITHGTGHQWPLF